MEKVIGVGQDQFLVPFFFLPPPFLLPFLPFRLSGVGVGVEDEKEL